ncbi:MULTISPECIES: hypothetical protein [unclassified Solwaraspora]|uniref:hypothetical protein n=1 Tax=unclassified Solwaraspora TaxID=2627926 RepID=UPI00259B5A8F|nr:hypothetical protein [Solwaraspora sp. WMMA2056]WJK38892.1 hypothetical protein O7608_20610 [Solwaraspora sp. WMMA2056]
MVVMPPDLDSDTPGGATTAARRGRRTRWCPVADLSPLARALLSDDLGGRDVVPQHVADRVSAQAEQWAGHGFTEHTVRPWRDLPPAAAGHLADRQVDPRVLDLPVEVVAGGPPVPLRVAIVTGRLPAERAYQLLVLTGEHVPMTTAPTRVDTSAAAVRPVTPVIFSHAQPDDES